ncbi:MAG: hypothetical protein ACFFCE_13530 [Promethearchaeota archaeon]
MKNEKLEMKREVWKYFRLYRQAPIKKKYLEKLAEEEINQPTKHYRKIIFNQ